MQKVNHCFARPCFWNLHTGGESARSNGVPNGECETPAEHFEEPASLYHQTPSYRSPEGKDPVTTQTDTPASGDCHDSGLSQASVDSTAESSVPSTEPPTVTDMSAPCPSNDGRVEQHSGSSEPAGEEKYTEGEETVETLIVGENTPIESHSTAEDIHTNQISDQTDFGLSQEM